MAWLVTLPPPLRWGILFGVPPALLLVVSALAGALGAGENLGFGSWFTFGYLFLPVLLLVVSASLFLAGKRTARQTRRPRDGVVAGLVAAEVCAVAVTLIVWVIGATHGAPPPYFIKRMIYPEAVAAVLGAGLGLVGGLVGA